MNTIKEIILVIIIITLMILLSWAATSRDGPLFVFECEEEVVEETVIEPKRRNLKTPVRRKL